MAKPWRLFGVALLLSACGGSGGTEQAIAVTILSGPAEGETTGSTVTFTYAAEPAAAGFRCTLDGASAECEAGGATYRGLAVGSHRFAVVATSARGASSAAAERGFLVGAAPTVAVTLDPAAGPESALVVGPSGDIEFHAVDAVDPIAWSDCRLDGAAVSPCASPVPWAGLADGTTHAFTVTATDTRLGESTTATRSFTVDAAGPAVEILTPDADELTGPDVSPRFTAADPTGPVAVTCTLDDVAYPCEAGTPFAAQLGDGAPVLRVVAEDAVGNRTVATRAFRVDATPPTVVFDSSPQWKACRQMGTPMSKPDAVVYFTSGDALATASFTCTLRDLTAGSVVQEAACPFSAEVRPGTYRYAVAQSPGQVMDDHLYTLDVLAVDEVGNQVTRRHVTWVVDAANRCP